MARKRWTKAMRAVAAEHGRKGGKVGSLAGKRRNGLVSWHGKSPDAQAETLARLRGRQTNTSPRAKRAQAARGRRAVERPRSAAQALLLADLGMMGRMPAAPPVAPPAQPQAAGRPRREDYDDVGAWLRAVNAWDAAAWRRGSGGGEGA